MQVKNTQPGPRGLNTATGPVMIEAGQTVDGVEMTAAELAAARKTGWFEFEGAAGEGEEPEPDAEPDAELDALNDDELRAYLSDHGVTADGRWQRKRLLVEAEKAKAAA